MILTRYAVCSERRGKPVTRLVCDTKGEADKALERFKQREVEDPEDDYWIAELGPETEGWRWLAPLKEGAS